MSHSTIADQSAAQREYSYQERPPFDSPQPRPSPPSRPIYFSCLLTSYRSDATCSLDDRPTTGKINGVPSKLFVPVAIANSSIDVMVVQDLGSLCDQYLSVHQAGPMDLQGQVPGHRTRPPLQDRTPSYSIQGRQCRLQPGTTPRCYQQKAPAQIPIGTPGSCTPLPRQAYLGRSRSRAPASRTCSRTSRAET